MMALAKVHFSHLPVWSEGNVYLSGAKAWCKEQNKLVDGAEVKIALKEQDGRYTLDTNLYDLLGGFRDAIIDTDTLGLAFEPEEKYENPDGTPITFNSDYFGGHRTGVDALPGPFAAAEDAKKVLFAPLAIESQGGTHD